MRYLKRFNNVSGYVMLGTLALAIIQIYFLLQSSEARKLALGNVLDGEVAGAEGSMLEIFFGSRLSPQRAQAIVEDKMDRLKISRSYGPSVQVIEKHEELIRKTARKYGVPEEVALGIGLVENGGSETAVSPAGALGIFQLMPGTARGLGLTVNKNIDERKNPEKNIDAGIRYLALNYYRFGDWGLATWAYHAGEGNVAQAVNIYTKSNHRTKLSGLNDVTQMRRYLDSNDITIHELLTDPQVKIFAASLKDDSVNYPYKVVARAALFNLAQN